MDTETVGLARHELLQVADAVAREKSIERDLVLDAMEQAITHAGKRKYGQEHDIRTEIDRDTGEIRLMRFLEVADPIENEATQISVEAAQERNPAAQVGDYLADSLPPIDFGRIAAQTAKQVIVQKVREAERARQYEEYKDRVGEIASGLVKRSEFGGVTVDLGRGEGVIRREDLLPRESFRNGDRVRGYIYDVRREQRGPQIFISRTHPNFMAKLFSQEVPEIYEGIIEIKSVANELIFKCQGPFACCEIRRSEESGSMEFIQKQQKNKVIQGEFSLKNLGYFIKCTNLCNSIEMYLENDLPLIVKYCVASLGEIKLCLAPLPSV